MFRSIPREQGLPLLQDKIILRWIATDGLQPCHRSALGALLTPDERIRASRLLSDKDRLSFTAAHGLARAVLTDLTGRSPLSWKFRRGSYGKPVPITRSDEPTICLNVSHTRGLAVVASSMGHKLGVDAEWLGRPAPLDVAESHFATNEKDYLYAHPLSQRHEVFFALWTLKEAYLKAIGKGMAMPLDSFALSLNPTCLLSSTEDVDLARWKFHQIRVGSDHLIALAVEWPRPTWPTILEGPADLDRLTALSAL